MSASASTSISSPPPPSPGRSSSSATATPPLTSTAGARHRSRPSFAIAYSQPPPPSISPSNHGIPATPGSSSTAGASASPTKRPFPSNIISNPPASTSQPPHIVPQPAKHFVVPAHPQSHHLHSLPPREKTTRTLILDHTAWLHGRTRFAQGRCELGMKVRFKSREQPAQGSSVGGASKGERAGFYIGTGSGSMTGPGRANAFGDPPEVELASSDEEGEDGEDRESDGEGVRALGYGRRSGRPVQKRNDGLTAEDKNDRMEVDPELESNSGYDPDGEPSGRNSPSRSRDASLAPSLAARATGMEKVLHAMLAQPPSPPPRSPSPPPYALHSSHAHSQHYRPPPSTQQPTSPTQSSATNGNPTPLLPNGLRLRLALLALVNDLFERQPAPPPEESPAAAADNASVKPQTSWPSTSTSPTAAKSSEPPKATPTPSLSGSPPPLPPPSLPPPNTLPSGLAPLAQISCQPFYAPPILPSFHTLTLPSLSGGGSAASTLSPISGTGTGVNATVFASSNFGGTASLSSRGSADGAHSPTQTHRPPPPLFMWSRPSMGPASPSSPLPISPHSVTPFTPPPYDKDPDRLSASSPTSPSISRPLTATPRSLPTSWKGSTPKSLHPATKGTTSSPGLGLTKRARGRSRELYSAGCYATVTSPYTQTSSFRSNVTTYTYGTGDPPVAAAGYSVTKLKTLCPRHLREKCGVCASGAGSRAGPSTRIGAGLLKREGGLVVCTTRGDDVNRESGSVLADLIPRFLRLSALVAMELGREARGEEAEVIEGQEEGRSDAFSTTSTSTVNPSAKSSSHAQPTRAWYALLCGLLTRAVLEGYVARAWKGAEYVEVLMGVGLGIKGVGTRRSPTGFGGTSTVAIQEVQAVEEEHAGEFEPDEMPGLIEASKVLFSGLVLDASAPGTKDIATRGAEEEYVVEMEERMSEFLTITHSTPDLATHLTQLSLKYPAEPVDRAALRFCEAVAKWRGKPELEMYKKSPVRSSTESQSSTPAPLSIHALLASTPTPAPHRPPIDTYFRVPPPSSRKPSSRTLKRQRSVDEEEREPKKEKVEPVDVDLSRREPADEAMQDVDSEWIGPYGV